MFSDFKLYLRNFQDLTTFCLYYQAAQKGFITMVDSLLNDGVLKQVPVLGTVISVAKSVGSIRDLLFIKKLAVFLNSMYTVEEKDRKKLLAKLGKDAKSAAYAGEMLIELLSRLDNAEKLLLVVKALKAYANDLINFIQLQRINHSIDRLLMCDIHQMKPFIESFNTMNTDGDPAILNFVNAGLAYVPPGLVTDGGVIPTETGKLFANYIL